VQRSERVNVTGSQRVRQQLVHKGCVHNVGTWEGMVESKADKGRQCDCMQMSAFLVGLPIILIQKPSFDHFELNIVLMHPVSMVCFIVFRSTGC